MTAQNLQDRITVLKNRQQNLNQIIEAKNLEIKELKELVYKLTLYNNSNRAYIRGRSATWYESFNYFINSLKNKLHF